jgi:hypothetical protein
MPLRPCLLTLGLLACADAPEGGDAGKGDGADATDGTDGSEGGDGDSGATGPTVDIFGYVKLASTDGPLAGVEAWSLDRPGERATSDAQGEWVMAVAERPYMRMRNEAPGLLAMEAWIDPLEAADPAYPYPYTMGSADDARALLEALGARLDLDTKAILFVDAIDPLMRDLAGAEVHLDGAFDGPWREYAPDQWDGLPLTTEDRSDLVYANVPPGPLSLSVVDPDGQPCAVPPGIEVFAGGIVQVSVYCEALADSPRRRPGRSSRSQP